jgi:hypothetical protein
MIRLKPSAGCGHTFATDDWVTQNFVDSIPSVASSPTSAARNAAWSWNWMVDSMLRGRKRIEDGPLF